jgi:hypothetical protein
MSLQRGPLSLVSTIEELLGRKSSGSGLEIREYGRRDPSRWPRGTLFPQKLALTLPTRGGCSVGIVRSRTLATEFVSCSVLALTNEEGTCSRFSSQSSALLSVFLSLLIYISVLQPFWVVWTERKSVLLSWRHPNFSLDAQSSVQCFKKSFTTLKAYINLFRRHV